MKVSHALGLSLASLGFCTFSWMAGCSSTTEKDAGADAGEDASDRDAGSGTGGSTGTTGSTTGGTVSPTCDEYCDLAIKSCGTSGVDAQWASKAQCVQACAPLPPGTGAETSGDSVSCRTYHAGVAGLAGNQTVHCPHSGYSGGGACGDRCEAFCLVATNLCVAPRAMPFASLQDCRSACGATGGFPGFDADAGAAGEYPATQSTKDNLNCRQYWLWEALKDVDGGDGGSAAANCPRLGLKGVTTNGLTPACVD